MPRVQSPTVPLASAQIVEHPALPRAARQFLSEYGQPRSGVTLPWEQLPEASRDRAVMRATLMESIDVSMRVTGCTARSAAVELANAIATGVAPPAVLDAARSLARKGGHPSLAQLQRWWKDYKQGGLAALADQHCGRSPKLYGWEARAINLYQKPSRPAFSTVAHWLRDEGHDSATDTRVRRYLKALPVTLTTHAPERLGRNYHRQNVKPYIVRDHSVVPVGMVYQGDGHCCDVYVQHPTSGGHFRPELTVWIDTRSRYVVGWWLSEAESAVSTLFALSHAIVKHDHVPAAIHTDPGSGFRNQMMNAESTGYLLRLSIEHFMSLAGNARGKGIIERFFSTFEERCGKRFSTYCGGARTDDFLARLQTKVRRGEIEVPTLAQYRDAIARFMEAYNNTPHSGLDDRTPASLWAELERVPVEIQAEAIVRPQERRKVDHSGIRLNNALYRDHVLAQYDGREVIAEYDLHDGSAITVRDLEGRLICDARLVEARPAMPINRIEQLEQNRLKGQIKRLAQKQDEFERRAGLAITHDQVLQDIEQAAYGIERKESSASWTGATAHDADPSSIELDLTRLDY